MIDWTLTAGMTTAIGSVLAATVWPTVVLVLTLVFRAEIKAVIASLPLVMDRAEKLSFAGLEATLREVKAAAGNSDRTGTVSNAEREAAVRIKQKAAYVDSLELALRMDALAREYDLLRRKMPSGSARTRAMTNILVQMRALGPSVADQIEVFKSSGSPGSRLAAIAIMQMLPHLVDPDWLSDRFRTDHPFVFYHAALALQNAANEFTGELASKILRAAEVGLEVVGSFQPTPDSETLAVLRSILAHHPEPHPA